MLDPNMEQMIRKTEKYFSGTTVDKPQKRI